MLKLQDLSFHLALLTIMASGLMMGAWHVPVIFGLMLLSLISLGLYAFYKGHEDHSLSTNPVFWLWATSIVFTVSMLVPIPASLHALLSPDSFTDLKHAYQLLGETPDYLFLSLDPYQTGIRLMQLITGFSIFIVISDRTRHRNPRKLYVYWLLAGAWAFFLLSLAYLPLVNRNNVARVFGLFALLCFALEPEAKSKYKHLALILTAIISGASVYITQSRWGMISFTISLFLFLRSWQLGIAILAGAALLGYDLIINRLWTLSTPETYWGKIELLKMVPTLLKQHWLIGIGQGALPIEYHHSIQPNYTADSLFSYYFGITYLENTTLQTLIDHGLLKGLVLFFLAIWIFWKISKKNIRFAAIFFFLWLADWADFSFESGTVLYLVAFAAAIAPLELKIIISGRNFAKLFALTSIVAFLAIWMVFAHTRVNYLDPQYAFAHHNKAWLEYALQRRPTYFSARLELARYYWNEQNHPKALEEYRLAIASNPNYLDFILREIAPIAPTYQERKKALPIINERTLNALCQVTQSIECFQEAKDWRKLIEVALAQKDPDSAMIGLQAFTRGKSPDGPAAVWFAEILTLQNGLEATLKQTEEWSKELKEPCDLFKWRLQRIKPMQGMSELESMQDCFDNLELVKLDLYQRDGQLAKALELTLSLLTTYPEDSGLEQRKQYLLQALKIK